MNAFCVTQALLTSWVSVTPNTYLEVVLDLIAQDSSNFVLVMQQEQLLGIITPLEIIRYLKVKENSLQVPVATVMREAIAVNNQELKLEEVIELLRAEKNSELVIINEFRQPLAIITAKSLLPVILSLQAEISQLQAQQQYQQQIETALKDIEKRYGTLVTWAPVGIFRTDIEGNCLYVNARWCEITGLTLQEAMGTGWTKGLHPQDRERITEQWQQYTQKKIPFRAEYRFQHPDHTVIWVVGEAIEERSQNGELLGYIGTLTDISDRKRTEETLAKTEATNRALLQALPDMLLLQNQQGIFSDIISKGELEPLVPPSEFIGKRIVDVLPPAVGKQAMQAIEAALRTNEMQSFEYQLHFGGNDWRDYEARVISMSNGEVLSIIRNISDLKQALRALQESEAALQQLNIELEQRVEQRTLALKESEEKFRTIFQESPIGMALIDLNNHFLQVNTAFCQMLGYTESELTGLSCLDITHHQDREKSLNLVKRVFKDKFPTATIEKRYLKKNGKILWSNLTACVIRKPNGQLLYGLGLIEDITERQKAEAQLRNSLEEKEYLLKEIHHRVKNNLQVISSLFSLQSQYIQDPKILAILEDSQTRISSMALIHEKLYQSDNLAKIDFADYIQTLVHNLLASYNSNPQQINCLCHVEDVSLNLDRAIPCGLLLNELVSNSLKHAFSQPLLKLGEIKIDFRVNQEQQFCLTVEDNGRGIPKGLDLQSSPSLGLRLVRILTRQLKGQLKVYNKDCGVVFQLIFPQYI